VNTLRLRLAVQNKGRIGTLLQQFFAQAGLKFEFQERQLIARCFNFPLDLIFVRHSDIPLLVADGDADAGIAGQDVLQENDIKLTERLALDIAKSSLCIAVPDGSPIQELQDLNGKKIATHFPNLTRRFAAEHRLSIELVPLRGSVEIAPQLGIADAIADLVGTGATLAMNKLRVVDTIMQSQAVLVQGDSSDPAKAELLDALVMRIQSVITARDKKLLVFNLPKAALPQLKDLHLGLSGPTVSELNGDNADMVAVQVVVSEADSWPIMAAIKDIGGSGILVMNIERLIA
jgi:ATP phosphoribosyltransferase